MRTMIDFAHDLDDDISDCAIERAHALRLIAREARRHDCRARVVGRGVASHVLVLHPDGGALATRSAARLAAWLGY